MLPMVVKRTALYVCESYLVYEESDSICVWRELYLPNMLWEMTCQTKCMSLKRPGWLLVSGLTVRESFKFFLPVKVTILVMKEPFV